jgi:hypothetical protein
MAAALGRRRKPEHDGAEHREDEERERKERREKHLEDLETLQREDGVEDASSRGPRPSTIQNASGVGIALPFHGRGRLRGLRRLHGLLLDLALLGLRDRLRPAPRRLGGLGLRARRLGKPARVLGRFRKTRALRLRTR